jgi:hypothetical protein
MEMIMVRKQGELEVCESRWRKFSERPLSGTVFAGRNENIVYNMLFEMKSSGEVFYFKDDGTKLGYPSDFFTHWLHIGEVK